MTLADIVQSFTNQSGTGVSASASSSGTGTFLAAAVSHDGQVVSQSFSDPSASGGFISVVSDEQGGAVFDHNFFHQFDLLA